MKTVFIIFVILMTINFISEWSGYVNAHNIRSDYNNRCPLLYRFEYNQCVPTWCKFINGECI